VDLKVTDSRDAGEFNGIRRRRECLACQRRFTTFETIELTMQVRKRDGRCEEYQEKKLISGMLLACRKTSISHEKVVGLASQITVELMQKQSKEISTTELGTIVMENLQRLDPIAYIRFACVYRPFKDVDELMEAIQSVQAGDSEIASKELINN
jgi:transcriptional repressor NrdR